MKNVNLSVIEFKKFISWKEFCCLSREMNFFPNYLKIFENNLFSAK